MKHLPAAPHGSIAKIFDNVWFVKGTVKMPMVMPMKISRSMTIVKNPETNELTLFNSMRLSEDGLKELEKLGEVKNVVRIAGFHGRDDGFYRDHYGAKIHALKGQVYSRKLDGKHAPETNYMEPDVWLTADSQLPVSNAELKIIESSTPTEALVLLKQDNGVLIAGDSLQNTPSADEFVNLLAKIMMKKMGFYKPCNVGPGWLQFASPKETEVRNILNFEFNHVLPAHGDPVIDNAREKFRPAIEGELKGCR